MINETAKSTVLIDGKQAEDELKNLTAESKKYREEMKRCQMANDKAGFDKAKAQYDNNQKAVKGLRTELFSLEKVMNNLSGASMNQLKAAQKAITAELNKMTRGTKEYIEKSKQVQQVNGQIATVRKEMNGTAGAQSSMWGKLGATVSKFSGYAVAAFGIIKGGSTIIESAQAASDKWEKAISGVKFAWDYLLSSLASGDFKNFITNIRDAASAGREYADILDNLADRNRALSVREMEVKIQVEELKRAYKDQSKSATERAKAAEELIKIEKQLAKDKQINDKIAFEAEVLRLTKKTKLKENELLELVKFYDKNEEIIKQAQKYGTALENVSNTGFKKFWAVLNNPIAAFSTIKHLKLVENASNNFIKNATPEIIKYNSLLQKYNRSSDADLNKLVELWRNTNQASLDYYSETAKAASTLSGLQDDIRKESEEKIKKSVDEKIKLLEEEYNQYKLYTTKQFTNGRIDQEQYNDDIIANEMAFLMAKKTILLESGQEITDINLQLAQKEIEITKQKILEKEKADKEYFDSKLEQLQREEEEIYQKAVDEENFIKDKMESGKQLSEQYGTSLGDAFGALLSNQEDSEQMFAQSMLKIAFDALRGLVKIWVAEIFGKQVASKGVLGIPVATALSGILYGLLGAAESAIGNSMSKKSKSTSQRFAGKYDVIGADDGRHYSADYGGPMQTGIYSKPTLVAEQGPELIVDAKTLRNIQVNFPGVLPAIAAARVQQRAEGNVSRIPASSYSDPEIKALIKQNSTLMALLAKTLKNGISADISYTNLKDKLDKGNAAQDRGSRI